MMVTIITLWDYSNLPDTDLQGFTQIPEFNNSINIFQQGHGTPTPIVNQSYSPNHHPPERSTDHCVYRVIEHNEITTTTGIIKSSPPRLECLLRPGACSHWHQVWNGTANKRRYDFNNSINIFQPEHPTHTHRTHFPEVPT